MDTYVTEKVRGGMFTEEASTRFFSELKEKNKKNKTLFHSFLCNCLIVVCCEVNQRMNVLKANLSFISLNTRGLKDNVKRKAIFLLKQLDAFLLTKYDQNSECVKYYFLSHLWCSRGYLRQQDSVCVFDSK